MLSSRLEKQTSTNVAETTFKVSGKTFENNGKNISDYFAKLRKILNLCCIINLSTHVQRK